MAGVDNQVVNSRYALYNGDCCEVMGMLPDNRVHLSVYSPPFAGLYLYSSSERDISNCASYEEFFQHYGFVISETFRVTMPGRMTAVHVADIPSGNSGHDHLTDFSGDVIRAHQAAGWHYAARYMIWKEPLWVRNRTLAKSLAHRTIVDDAVWSGNAAADYLLVFRKPGDNPEPVTHPHGLMEYAGGGPVPTELHRFRGWQGKQTENRFSHWIWRRYASCVWDDIRGGRVLPYLEARDDEDEKHVHPLQLDVIERAVTLWSNPGDTVLTPFMGVGSEVYGAVLLGRRGVGIELKPTYFRQAVANLETIERPSAQQELFDMDGAAGDLM